MADIMHSGYLSSMVTTIPTKFTLLPSVSNSLMVIGNNYNSVDILTDEQFLALMYSRWTEHEFPLNYIYAMIDNTPSKNIMKIGSLYIWLC